MKFTAKTSILHNSKFRNSVKFLKLGYYTGYKGYMFIKSYNQNTIVDYFTLLQHMETMSSRIAFLLQ